MEEALPRLIECELEKSVEVVHGENRSRMRWLPPKGPTGLDERNKKRNGVLGEGEAEWKMAATSLHDDVLLDTEEGDK